jgi:hypothetical protein
MEKKVNRRVFVASGIAALVGGIIGAGAGRAFLPPIVQKEVEVKEVEVEKPVIKPITWPGGTLGHLIPADFRFDDKYVIERAFSGYKAVCCCFGIGDAILGTLIDKLTGNPWDYLPGRGAYDPTKPLGKDRYKGNLYHPKEKQFYGFTGWFHFGCGGMSKWGDICGAVAAVHVVASTLFGRRKAKLPGWDIADQVAWSFVEGPIPTPEVADHIAKQKGFTEGEDYTIVDRPGTTQCHAYVAKITKALGVGPKDKPRSHTCGMLTATQAVQLSRLLNEQIEKGEITKALAIPATAEECLACHGAGGIAARQTWGRSDCVVCHKETWKHP